MIVKHYDSIPYPPRSKKLSMMSTSFILRILLQMVAMVTSVGVAGFPSLSPPSSDILSKGGNAALSNFPVACTTGILKIASNF